MIKITKYDLFSSLYCKTVLFLKSQFLKIVIEYIKDINKRVYIVVCKNRKINISFDKKILLN